MPIGQVLRAAGRDHLVDCTPEELEVIRLSKQEFAQEGRAQDHTVRAAVQPHYLRQPEHRKPEGSDKET
jgi:hypothetical protein